MRGTVFRLAGHLKWTSDETGLGSNASPTIATQSSESSLMGRLLAGTWL